MADLSFRRTLLFIADVRRLFPDGDANPAHLVEYARVQALAAKYGRNHVATTVWWDGAPDAVYVAELARAMGVIRV